MALNMLKLCVGVSEIDELESWVKDCRKGLDTLDHVTRMFPKRKSIDFVVGAAAAPSPVVNPGGFRSPGNGKNHFV